MIDSPAEGYLFFIEGIIISGVYESTEIRWKPGDLFVNFRNRDGLSGRDSGE